MAERYSDDLRAQVVAYVEQGNSIRDAAAKFSVSPSFVAKSHKKFAEMGAELPLSGDAETETDRTDTHGAGVSAADLAEWLGVSKRAISDFVERGIVVKTEWNRFDLKRSVSLYCEHIRMAAAGRGGDADDLTAERTRLAREQADQTAMKNAAMRGEYLSKTEVRHEWTSITRRLRNVIMAVPSRCRQMLPHLTTYDVDLIDHEIRSALTGLGDESDDHSVSDTAEGSMGQPTTAAQTEAFGMD